MKNLFLLFIIIFLSGCSNGFSKYYQGENLIENKNEASNYEMTEDVKSAPLPNYELLQMDIMLLEVLIGMGQKKKGEMRLSLKQKRLEHP